MINQYNPYMKRTRAKRERMKYSDRPGWREWERGIQLTQQSNAIKVLRLKSTKHKVINHGYVFRYLEWRDHHGRLYFREPVNNGEERSY